MTVVWTINIQRYGTSRKGGSAIRGSESLRQRNLPTMPVGWNNTTSVFSREAGEDFQEADRGQTLCDPRQGRQRKAIRRRPR